MEMEHRAQRDGGRVYFIVIVVPGRNPERLDLQLLVLPVIASARRVRGDLGSNRSIFLVSVLLFIKED